MSLIGSSAYERAARAAARAHRRAKTRGTKLLEPRFQSVSSLLISGTSLDLDPISKRKDQLEAYSSGGGWVYACGNLISQEVRRSPWSLYEKTGRAREEWTPLDDEALPGILRRPNRTQTWGELIELTQLHLDLTGEAYWHLITSDLGMPRDRVNGRLRVQGIELIYPHWIDDVRYDASGRRLEGYWVTIPGRVRIFIAADDVIFHRYPHPLDPTRGASPVQAFALSHRMDLYARAYGASSLKNWQSPPGLLSSDQELLPEHAQAIRERWKDSRTDPTNIAVLGKGAKYTPIALGIGDVEFLKLARMTRDQILAIYHVPASKLGLEEDSNRATDAGADRNYAQNTMLPRLIRLQDTLNTFLLPLILERPQRFALEYDNPVPTDRAFEFKKWHDSLTTGTIQVNEYNRELGLPEQPSGDVYLVPNTHKILDALEPEAEPEPAAAPGQMPLQLLPGGVEDQEDEAEPDEAARALVPHADPNRLDPGYYSERDVELIELRFLRSQERLERQWRNRARAIFSREQRELLRIYREQREPPRVKLRNVDLDWSQLELDCWEVEELWTQREALQAERRFLEFDLVWHSRDAVDEALEFTVDAWRALFEELGVDALEAGWNLLEQEVGRSLIAFDLYRPEAQRWAVSHGANEIRRVGDTTRRRVRRTIAKSISEGESVDQTAQRIARLYDGFRGVRAQTIARTETATAVNAGKTEHATEAAARLRLRFIDTWITTIDERTRRAPRDQFDHVVAHREEVWHGQPFSRTGEPLLYPLDPAASAGNKINCRCTTASRVADPGEAPASNTPIP